VSRILTVLSAQVAPVAWDPPATLDRFEEHVRMARRAFPDADLMIFPELYLTAADAFTDGGADEWERRVAEEVPGPLTDRVGKIAARAKRWIVAGSINERSGERIHNTAIAFSPEGALVAAYRKLFPWRPYESVDPGDEPAPVFEIPGKGRVGLMICYDGWFPEVARGLALQGAELIAQPTATTTPDREEEVVLARANAIANQVYLFNPNLSRRSARAGASGSIPRDVSSSRAVPARSCSSRSWTSTGSPRSALVGPGGSAGRGSTSSRGRSTQSCGPTVESDRRRSPRPPAGRGRRPRSAARCCSRWAHPPAEVRVRSSDPARTSAVPSVGRRSGSRMLDRRGRPPSIGAIPDPATSR
jgi:predicted amidohydrolase